MLTLFSRLHTIAILILAGSTVLSGQESTRKEIGFLLSPSLRIPSTDAVDDDSASMHVRLVHQSEASSTSMHLLVITDNETDLSYLGFDVNSRVGSVSTVDISADRLAELARVPGVRYIQEDGIESASSSSNALVMGALDVHQGILGSGPITGKGVLMAIFDSGIDLASPLFRDPNDTSRTRFIGVWDQTISIGGFSAPQGFSYGTEILQPGLDALLNAGRVPSSFGADRTGHGTGVAAIAAGSGEQIGIAPKASLLIIKGGDRSFSENGIVDALHYIDQTAERLGVPVVVNLSIGSHRGPHDGTRVYEKAIDEFTSRPGRVVVVAAGNDGMSPLHAEARLASSLDSVEIPWIIPQYVPNDGDTNDQLTMELWYEAGDSLELTIVSPNGFELTTSTGSPYGVSNNADGCLFLDNATYGPSPVHGKNLGFIHLTDFQSWVPASGEWALRIKNLRSGPTGWIHAWIVENTSDSYSATFTAGHPNTTTSALVRSPGNARSAITVGSGDIGSVGNTASWFSSVGPTANGLLKPDFIAPGNGVQTRPAGSASVDHGLRTGTSYASPQIAGLTALILQITPAATVEDVREFLKQGTSEDAWQSDIGYGMPDGIATLLAAQEEPFIRPEILRAMFSYQGTNEITLAWTPRTERMVRGYSVYAVRTIGEQEALELIGSVAEIEDGRQGQISITSDHLRSGSFIICETDSLGRSRNFGHLSPQIMTSAPEAAISLSNDELSSFPNPFNAMATINIRLRRTQEIHLGVYDLLGRLVRTLSSGLTQAGEHLFRLDAGSMASGLYFVRLVGQDVSITKRIQLVK